MLSAIAYTQESQTLVMIDNLDLSIRFTLQAGVVLSIKLKSQTSSGL